MTTSEKPRSAEAEKRPAAVLWPRRASTDRDGESASRFRQVWDRYRPHLAAVGVVLVVMFLEFRRMFSYGYFVTPDLFLDFPATTTPDGLLLHLSKWNPANLGNESAQPAGFALISLLVRIGLFGSALQAVVILGLTFVAGLGIWRFAVSTGCDPTIALLAPVLYLAGPNLFILVFNASIDIVLYALLPLLAILAFRIARAPTWRDAVGFGLIMALDCAFEPFGLLFIPPFVLTILLGTALVSPSVRRTAKSLAAILLSSTLAILLNAPYYLGNFGYFVSQGVTGAAEANTPVIQNTYRWSTPTRLFALIGNGLYPRYAGYYPAWAEALLLIVPAVALTALLRSSRVSHPEVRLSMGLLIVFAVAWVSLTRAALAGIIFVTFPYLLVFNYPAIFYLYLGLAFACLAPIALGDFAAREPPNLGDRSTTERGAERQSLRIRELWPASIKFGLTHAPLILASVLILAVLAPANFYLISGDFRVLEAPSTFGFPPQWGAVAPPSFEEIYRFVQSHGGDQDARLLVLPSPRFAGAASLPGYSINLFNQPQYTGAVYTGPFFQVQASQEYATTVLDYLVENRTDLIGIPLGVASVKYVIVDKQLNFTGSPRWFLSSMIGSPESFMKLLDGQRDLTRVYDNSLIAVYENHDFRPYLQSYPGVTSVREGRAPATGSEPVYTWPINRQNWTLPQPPQRMAAIVNRSDGYIVIAAESAGEMSIRFQPNATWPGIVGNSSRLDNDGIYIGSEYAAVGDDEYIFRYTADYSGLEPHLGGQVFLDGVGANRTVLWQLPTCCPTTSVDRDMEFRFIPALIDPATAYVSVLVAFPYRMASGSVTTYSVSNLSLSRAPRTSPPDVIGSLILPQLPRAYASRPDAMVVTRNQTLQQAAELGRYPGRINRLCLDYCERSGSDPWDQLYFAYNSLILNGNVASRARATDSIAGFRVDVAGPASASLSLAGYPVQAVFVRASGNGTISPTIGASSLTPVSVSNSTYRWYEWLLSQPTNDTTFNLSTTGSLRLDAMLFASASSLSATPSGNASLQYAAVRPTEYRGFVSSNTTVLFLAQAFNSAWSLEIAGQILASIPGLGWANLFVVPGGTQIGLTTPFSIVLLAQAVHDALILVQAGSLMGVAVWVLYLVFRRVARHVQGILKESPTGQLRR